MSPLNSSLSLSYLSFATSKFSTLYSISFYLLIISSNNSSWLFETLFSYISLSYYDSNTQVVFHNSFNCYYLEELDNPYLHFLVFIWINTYECVLLKLNYILHIGQCFTLP